jgi:hypothetical protein
MSKPMPDQPLSDHSKRPPGPPDPPRIPGHLGEPTTPEWAEKINGYWRRRAAWMARAEDDFRESERQRRESLVALDEFEVDRKDTP